MVVRVGLTHTNYNSYLVGTIWCVLVFGNHSIWEVKVLISEIADCFLTPMGILAFRVDPTISVIQLFRLLRLRLNEPWVRHLSPCHLCFGDKKKAHFWGCTEVEKDHLGSKKKDIFVCLILTQHTIPFLVNFVFSKHHQDLTLGESDSCNNSESLRFR